MKEGFKGPEIEGEEVATHAGEPQYPLRLARS